MKTPPHAMLPALPLPLMLTMGCWLNWPFALQCANSALPPLSNPGKALPRENAALRKALEHEAKSRAHDLLSGIRRYCETPYARTLPQPPCIWSHGNARLLDYGQHVAQRRDTPIVLFVPSLINRYYILDLEADRSMLRYMASQGVYPLVMDWGAPGKTEQPYDCSDYVTEILLPAIEFITRSARRRITMAGYCMGGVLSLAAAQLRRSHISSLALFATPWDFHCKAFFPFVVDPEWQAALKQRIEEQGELSPEIVQLLFYITDPWVFEQKFRRYASLQPHSRAARDFVALEHWVNDGVPMTARVASDCLIGWAQKNRLLRRQWQVGGVAIDPASMRIPTFIALPRNDHVVPRDCALPLAEAMARTHIVEPGAGHVGMIVGSHARRELWQPFTQWLRDCG